MTGVCVCGPLGCGGCLSYWARDMVLRWYGYGSMETKTGMGFSMGRRRGGRRSAEPVVKKALEGVMPVWASRHFSHLYRRYALRRQWVVWLGQNTS